MGQVINLDQVRQDQYGKRAKISVSLKRLARENRKQLVNSYPYIKFWLTDISLQHYQYFLKQQLAIRNLLESRILATGEQFNVTNQFTNHHKHFKVVDYLPSIFQKSNLIKNDLTALGVNLEDTLFEHKFSASEAELPLFKYIERTAEVYSVALLGILYMVEDNLYRSGTTVAQALQGSHKIDDQALTYLNAYNNNPNDLWAFRDSLDSIEDFQSQANIVIAATITFQMFQDLLEPKNIRKRSLKNSK